MKLRSHLVVLALATLLPMMAFSAGVLVVFWQEEQAAVERSVVHLARTLALSIERELENYVTILEGMAASEHLTTGDLEPFYDDARDALSVRGRWTTMLLTDRSGQALVDVRRPFGARDLQHIGDTAYFQRVVRTGSRVVSDLQGGPPAGFSTAVAVPVERAGALRYVLVAIVEQAHWSELLKKEQLSPDRLASIVDRANVIVARSRDEASLVGTPAPSAVAARVAAGATFLKERSADGQLLYAAFAAVPLAGWTLAYGTPAAAVDAAMKRLLAAIGAAAVLSVAAAGAGAALVGRRLSRPIRRLAELSEAVGRSESVPPPIASGVDEIDTVTHAFGRTAALLQAREAELAALLRQEQAARDEAESVNRAKDQFLATLSHELRTPLTAILGWTRLLRSGTLAADARRNALEVIDRNARIQTQLIDDLLDLSRISAGKLRLDVKRVDLDAVIETALEAIRPTAAARGVDVSTVIEPGLRPVMGDPDRLQQVLWNLLTNAVKFTDRGGRVEVRARRIEREIDIAVTDTGCGIDPAVLPFVFERFRQEESSTTRRHGGLGIGLALVRQLVELHGGTVSAHSDGKGKGSRFTVRLPVAPAEKTAAETAPRAWAARRESVAPPSLEGVRVLAVDDDDDARVLLTEVLTGCGADVRTAQSASEGLHLVQTWQPAVVLSDIEMPGEDGYSFIRRVRSLGAPARSVPVAAVTAHSRVEDRVRALGAGFDLHVPKPFDPDELVAVVQRLSGHAGRVM